MMGAHGYKEITGDLIIDVPYSILDGYETVMAVDFKQ